MRWSWSAAGSATTCPATRLMGRCRSRRWGRGQRTFSRVLFETARRENMTLRDLYNLTAAARGHWVLCGTPQRIADALEQWFVEGAADGFNILPPYFPGAFDDFVDLVVPELQRRGLFRRDYEGTTLRDHFGLPRVAG